MPNLFIIGCDKIGPKNVYNYLLHYLVKLCLKPVPRHGRCFISKLLNFIQIFVNSLGITMCFLRIRSMIIVNSFVYCYMNIYNKSKCLLIFFEHTSYLAIGIGNKTFSRHTEFTMVTLPKLSDISPPWSSDPR